LPASRLCRTTHEVSVRLHTSLAQARRRIPPTAGTLTEVADGVRLTARAERLHRAACMLAGLGWPFTVEYPDELRTEVRALATRLLTHATPDNDTDASGLVRQSGSLRR
jgi:hypothetical protein